MYRNLQKLLLLPFSFLLITATAFAQRTVTGRITDQANNQPIPGVNVGVKGTTTIVITDADGRYSIAVPSNMATLIFSYVGYGTQEIPVGTSTTLSPTLSSAQRSMDEVVVIGYGTVRRRDLTGAVSSIKNEDLVRTPTFNATEALQGRIAGADITRSSGAAGAGVNIRIRGNRSFGGDRSRTEEADRFNNPLVIIDGFQGGNLSDLNPNDIETIDVLKDASSTAIYGAQGANGVIIVTTKKGIAGKTSVTYDGFYGINGYASFPKPRLGESYLQLRREAFRTAGQWSSPADDPKLFTNADELKAVQAGQWVNWFDLINRNGQQQSHTVSVRSGSERTKSLLSLGYFREEGMLKRNDFTRYNVRFNLDHNLFKWAKAGLLSQVTYSKLNSRRDPLSVAYSTAPLGVPYDAEGKVNLYPLPGNTAVISPLTDERGEGIAQDNTLRANIVANGYLEIAPIRDLTIRSNLGTTLNFSRRGIFNEATSLAQRNTLINTATVTNGLGRFFNWDNIITYNKRFKEHALTITGVVGYIQSDAEQLEASGDRQLLSSQGFFSLSSARQIRDVSSTYEAWNNVSYSGRINYTFKSKYLFTATYRADGASRLATGNKWDYFPSVALGWNISQESFLQNLGWVNNLKVRGSWGKAGNYGIRVYGTQSLIIPGQNMGFGDVQANYYQFNPTIGNDELGWETSTTTNVGLDFGFLKNRISGSFEWYNTITTDILALRSLPFSTGVASTFQNIGESQNKGVELTLYTQNIAQKNFSWNTTTTFTKNSEKITKLIGTQEVIFGATPETQSLILGRPINSFYSYRKLGVWQSKDAGTATRYRFGTTPFREGDLRIDDINGDSLINTNDRVYLGSTVPDFVLGLQNNFTYKGFDLNVFLFWRYGQMLNAEFLGRYSPSGGSSSGGFSEGSGPANLDYWTPENPTNDFPRPRQGQRFIDIPAYQALYFVDGSFFKIKTATLGYTFGKNLAKKVGGENIRFYVTGNNIFTKAKSHLVKDY
ncbi:MAG TPA: TonB-dependent receptor, partial [Flavisolibacter sp.]|nr:TonB-dependent receptor [Flavisolibacter sp.]